MSLAPPAVAGGLGDREHIHNTGDGVLLCEMTQLSVGDEKSIELKVNESGNYYSGKSAEGEGYSPSSKRYTPPFVRKCIRSMSDDPFQSNPKSRTGGVTTPKSTRILAENWRSGSSTSSDRPESESPLTAKSNRKNSPGNGGPPGPGYTVVTAEHAQAIYPPSCCVFVANLLQTESEESLQMAVTQIFREFGPVYVKIRRDAKHMPFAFCQYTKAEHADRAIQEGKGRLIRGRPCRCEKAKAHRLFLIERKFGAVITPDEARELLQQFGNIELCYTASHVERTALNLNEGVIVQFELYDDGQNAYSAFRSNETYKLQSIAGLGSPGRGTPARTPPQSDTVARAYIARYELDRRSIFVGNLPAGTTIHQVNDLFVQFGQIEEILLRETTSKFDAEEKLAFAFIEFASANAVANAITTKNGTEFGGRIMRVTQKDSETSSSRIRQRVPAPINTSATYRSPARRVDLPISPASSQMSPGAYQYPFSPYSYSPASYLFDTQHHPYMSAPYSPYTPYSPLSPGYGYYAGGPGSYASASPTAQATANADTTPAYYGYSPYAPYGLPAPGWTYPGQTEQQEQPQVIYYPGAYGQTVNVGSAENRSSTPTPAGHSVVNEESIEIQ